MSDLLSKAAKGRKVMYGAFPCAVLLVSVSSLCWAQAEHSLVGKSADLIKFEYIDQKSSEFRHQPSRFAASVILLNTPEIPVNAQVFSAASPAFEHGNEPKHSAWASSGAWQIVSNGDRPSLAPRLRMELQGGKLEVTPRRHSIWVEWQMSLGKR